MGSNNNAPTWADQWGSGGGTDDNNAPPHGKKSGSDNKLAKVKSVANTGYEKAKIAAIFGATKVKVGSIAGFKWLKTQYQKRSSK